jgi:CBS domain-containing protein
MNVRDIMTTTLITVDKDRNLKDVLALMRQHNITKIPVTDDGQLVGIVSDGKVVDKLGRMHNRNVQTTTMHASSVMEKDFIVAHPDEPLDNLLADVGKPGITMVPVVQGTRLVGVVTKANLLGLVQSRASVQGIMQRQVHAVGPEERLVHARRLLLDNDIARLPVVEKGRVKGIIAEHEIAEAFAGFKEADAHVQRANIRDLMVGPYMRRDVVTIAPEASAQDAARLMMQQNIGGLPVVNAGGVLQGIVTRTDLIRTFAPAPRQARLLAAPA